MDTAVSDEEGVSVEAVVCAFVEDGVDETVGVVEVGVETAADVGVTVVGEAVVEAPVPTGTF